MELIPLASNRIAAESDGHAVISWRPHRVHQDGGSPPVTAKPPVSQLAGQEREGGTLRQSATGSGAGKTAARRYVNEATELPAATAPKPSHATPDAETAGHARVTVDGPRIPTNPAARHKPLLSGTRRGCRAATVRLLPLGCRGALGFRRAAA